MVLPTWSRNFWYEDSGGVLVYIRMGTRDTILILILHVIRYEKCNIMSKNDKTIKLLLESSQKNMTWLIQKFDLQCTLNHYGIMYFYSFSVLMSIVITVQWRKKAGTNEAYWPTQGWPTYSKCLNDFSQLHSIQQSVLGKIHV